MLSKLTPISLIVVICLAVFLVIRISAASNGFSSTHNLLGIAGLALMAAGMLFGGGQSYKSDTQNRTKADIVLMVGFFALVASYGIRYFWR